MHDLKPRHVSAVRCHNLNMVDASPHRYYQPVLVRVDDFHELVGVGLVPKNLQIAVVIVAKEHMSLSDEMLVRVCI